MLNCVAINRSTVKNDFPQVMFDLPTIKQKFGSIEEGRNMIVHEQLSAMEKLVKYGRQYLYQDFVYLEIGFMLVSKNSAPLK